MGAGACISYTDCHLLEVCAQRRADRLARRTHVRTEREVLQATWPGYPMLQVQDIGTLIGNVIVRADS